MRRKLVKQGQNALTVTLPAKWAKRNSLKAGDEVEIGEEDKNILISGIGEAGITSKTIKLEDSNKNHLRSVIASAYKSGYDEIILKFKEKPSLKEINSIINTFTGLEFLSQEKKGLVIKSFLRAEEENTENLIIKLFQMAKLIADTINKEGDKIDLKNFTPLVPNFRKLRDHCLRNIHANRYGGDKSYDHYDFVTILEKIAFGFYELAELISSKRIKKSSLIEELNLLLEEFYQSYLKKDFFSANRLWLKVGGIKDKKTSPKTLSQTIKKNNPLLVFHYFYLLRLYRHLSSRLVSLSS